MSEGRRASSGWCRGRGSTQRAWRNWGVRSTAAPPCPGSCPQGPPRTRIGSEERGGCPGNKPTNGPSVHGKQKQRSGSTPLTESAESWNYWSPTLA
ncbi:hypothetical protein NDU88_006873 [Pleurodeles waltl]|uniref:Uncharacterized protein n=1 Tax=Pleurodeles waltl TaxID=8319 RepID=A0AAV7N8L0_PLEWA|nr:hypothetical protein NDU88_006873 [Pleurodeles waltl]